MWRPRAALTPSLPESPAPRGGDTQRPTSSDGPAAPNTPFGPALIQPSALGTIFQHIPEGHRGIHHLSTLSGWPVTSRSGRLGQGATHFL